MSTRLHCEAQTGRVKFFAASAPTLGPIPTSAPASAVAMSVAVVAAAAAVVANAAARGGRQNASTTSLLDEVDQEVLNWTPREVKNWLEDEVIRSHRALV